jgi:isopenicillin N synthase-like dioxygenase
MREVVLAYMEAMRRLGDLLLRALAASLGLLPEYFGAQFDHPTQLFRLFHYPPHDPAFGARSQAVGEHTDYGYLTILKQDQTGGLQVKRNK